MNAKKVIQHNVFSKSISHLLLILVPIFITGCQSLAPTKPLANIYGNIDVIKADFNHIAVTTFAQSQRLHVYIEGDGEAFEHRFFVSRDPGPRYPMFLTMMQQDKNRSLYLGRPCYFINATPDMNAKGCDSIYWTSARYSEKIIHSMVQALRIYLLRHPSKGVTLIGHSGGGAIAMLMAARMPEVDQVVTLAGNLNTQAWARYHFYSPLKQSLNPATSITSAVPKRQLHYAGAKDDNIPAKLGNDFLNKLGFQYKIVADADHDCCWYQHWTSLLAEIETQMSIVQQ